ncbi:MAG: hypothetical protein QNJ77_10570 [Acidimicrobiia bacterium]|nr:hypothetical protein [Acidimicrobiia bacterium]
MSDLGELIEASDLDGLIRRIDGICAARQWDDLVELRDRCLEAVTRGKQLWGVAQFAEYRLALDAPAEFAGRVVREGAGRFALGPLWEVAASTHTWEELSTHIADERLRTLVAHERVLRGETISASVVDPYVLELPIELQEWEPVYGVAAYRSDRADFPERELPALDWIELAEPQPRRHEDDALEALLGLTQPWTEQSNGRSDGVAVEGSAYAAIRTLGPHRVRATEIDFQSAVALMAWTGASGGAYGRRRGSPVGRMLAWWAVAALLGLDNVDEPAVLGEEGPALRWVLWDPGDQIGGWAFHLAVEDPDDGLAWAVSAVDAV